KPFGADLPVPPSLPLPQREPDQRPPRIALRVRDLAQAAPGQVRLDQGGLGQVLGVPEIPGQRQTGTQQGAIPRRHEVAELIVPGCQRPLPVPPIRLLRKRHQLPCQVPPNFASGPPAPAARARARRPRPPPASPRPLPRARGPRPPPASPRPLPRARFPAPASPRRRPAARSPC